MSISLANIKSGASNLPPRIVGYGVHGIGKTSFGASAPAPIFIQTEDGLGTLDCPTFGILRTFDEVLEAVGSLFNEDHQFQTAVIDSADHLEPLIWAQACKDNGWKSIEDAGYGKGYVAALDLWRVLFEGLDMLRTERGMTVIILAHSTIQRFDSPEHEPYDRYQPKLHKAASALLQEWADCVLFFNYRLATVKADAGFNKKVTRAIGQGDRQIHTQERPAFLAKQRYGLEDTLPMDWDAFAAGIPFYQMEQSNG